MNLLLDTHTFLWFWWDDSKLSEDSRCDKSVLCPAGAQQISPGQRPGKGMRQPPQPVKGRNKKQRPAKSLNKTRVGQSPPKNLEH